jgi:Nitrate reductase gamma subunit
MLQTVYNFAIGPLAWVAWTVFIVGSLWRVSSIIRLAKKKEMNAVAYMDTRYALRSIGKWMTPFGTLGWQQNPGLTVATFLFHISFLSLAIFAPAHVVLWDYSFGISLWKLPESVVDPLTVLALACCVFFIARRLANACTRYVSGSQDWLILGLLLLLFLSAFLAKMHIGDALVMSLVHVLSGLAVLIAIPFTRLSHALLAPLTRAYMGSEFGGVRNCPDW